MKKMKKERFKNKKQNKNKNKNKKQKIKQKKQNKPKNQISFISFSNSDLIFNTLILFFWLSRFFFDLLFC